MRNWHGANSDQHCKLIPRLTEVELNFEHLPEVNRLAALSGRPEPHLLNCKYGFFVETVGQMANKPYVPNRAIHADQGSRPYDTLHFVLTCILGVVMSRPV